MKRFVILFLLFSNFAEAEVKLKLTKDLTALEVGTTLHKQFGKFVVKAIPEIRASSEGYSSEKWELELEEKSQIRNKINFKEAGIEYVSQKVEVSIGKVVINWGDTYLWNSINILSRFDLSDLVDPDTIGTLAFRSKYFFTNMGSIEVGVSKFVPHRLPAHPLNRWFIPPPAEEMLIRELPEGVEYAARVVRSDWFVVGGYGYNPYPYFIPQQRYFRRFVVGMGTNQSSLGIVFKPRLVFFAPDKETRDDLYSYAVVRADKFFSNILGETDLLLALEYSKEIILEVGKIPQRENWSRIFKDHVIGRLEVLLPGESSLIFQGLYNLSGKDSYINLTLSKEFYSYFKSEVFVDLLAGRSETFFGRFNDRDRLGLTLTYRR